MTPCRLTRFAGFLLRVLLRGQETLAGDLVEEFGAGRSRMWLWRQVVAAAVLAPVTGHGPAAPHVLGLGEDRDVNVVVRPRSPASARERPINITASPIHGVGGLGLLVFAVLVTIVRPDAWTFALYGPIGGVAVALTLGLLRRRVPDSPPVTHVALRS